MKTLHDALKKNSQSEQRSSHAEDLRGRYSKIGISAVAAATQFNRASDKPAPHPAADRSSARGWSSH